ncbi:HD-GYP domain-containing protein [Candidatus Zixiibacteriota bacterium]
MSRDFLRKVWSIIYEEQEGGDTAAAKSGGKVATELTLADVGFIYGAAIDLAEGHAFGHAQRVAYIAQEMAVTLEMDDEEIADITLAALFHDVGLLSITHELTELSSAPETELLINHARDEVEDLSSQVRSGNIQKVSELFIKHVRSGSEVIENLPLPPGVARLVLGHHEHYDGSGYPEGLRGDDIPLALRVLTAADCLETAIAGAGERGHSPEFVRSEAMQLSGKQIDPNISRGIVEATQNVRFWGVFTGGQLSKQLTSRFPQERLAMTYGDIATFMNRLVWMVDGKSPYRQYHSWNVAKHSFLMSMELGLAEDLSAALGMAGLVHDLGKAGVSNQILDKPKWLTGPEYELAKKHINYTLKIIGLGGGMFDDLNDWIKGHHERLDGSGYPSRLKGDQLSREVRIISTADVYDALISDRPYRKGLDAVAAVRFMEGKVNRYFDPEVLGALGAVVGSAPSD